MHKYWWACTKLETNLFKIKGVVTQAMASSIARNNQIIIISDTILNTIIFVSTSCHRFSLVINLQWQNYFRRILPKKMYKMKYFDIVIGRYSSRIAFVSTL